MRTLLKLIAIIVVILLLSGSAYIIFFTNTDDDNNNVHEDTTPPVIDSITGDTTGTAGKTTTIAVSFKDNVTEATLYYKESSASIWSSMSILNGTADITFPSTARGAWYYYVVIDDAAGNGPVGDPSVDGSSYYTITVTQPEVNLKHTVFMEEGTATWCTNCPTISTILHDLYTSGTYDFYYVALIEDANSKAKTRLETDYNITGYPTVFIDGGYDVVFGANNAASVFEEKINKAAQRDVPKIALSVTSEVNNVTNILTTTVTLTNYEDALYTGRLRVYLTTKISTQDHDGNPYHFGLVDYITTEDITASSYDITSVSKTYDVSSLDIENLMIIAVVFDTQSTQKYSNPLDNTGTFNAFFADACTGTEVVEGGNLPPSVGITSPEIGKFHWFGKPKFSTPKLVTRLVGRLTITAVASDDSAISKVEFFIDDEPVATFTAEPYEYLWKSPSILFRKHTISVVAYDDQGKSSVASMNVTAFRLL